MSLTVGAYTRHPRALLLSQEGADTLLCCCARQPQPTPYRGVTLRHAIGPLEAGTRIHSLSVDWYQGSVAVYGSSQDALNRVPLHKTVHGLPPCPQEHGDTYVRETFAYLLRGHSLHHAQCTCPPITLRRDRALALGVVPWWWQDDSAVDSSPPPTVLLLAGMGRIGAGCPVGTGGEWRTVREIELELGVLDLHGLVDISVGPQLAHTARMPLLRALIQMGGLVPEYDARDPSRVTRLGSPMCCIPRTIASAEDVVRAAEVLAPRPFLYTPDAHDVVGRQCIDQALRAMQADQRVRVLQLPPCEERAEPQRCVFWNAHPDPSLTPDLNAEMRAVWARLGPGPPPPHHVRALPPTTRGRAPSPLLPPRVLKHKKAPPRRLALLLRLRRT
jgi:hypothetical protein